MKEFKAIKVSNKDSCLGCCFVSQGICAILQDMVDKKYLDELIKLPDCSDGYIYTEEEND